MVFEKVLALRGPNIWANFPVLEAWIDIGPFEQRPSDTLPGFNERLMQWIPSMIEHRCSLGERGGFFERLRRGTYLGHILEHVTLELQSLAGPAVGFGRARETSREGVYRVAIEYHNEELARACLESAFALCMAAAHQEDYNIAEALEKLRRIAHEKCLGPSTRTIADAAQARGIPTIRLNEGSMLQLGYGSRQRRIWAAETDNTSAISEAIAGDKQLARTLLGQAGVPVPVGVEVTSADAAWQFAHKVGRPVVIKPNGGNHGRGVSTDLTTESEIRAAFDAACEHSSHVIVEQHIYGDDYRLLVVNGQLVAAARREPAHVIGDGQHTVAQLVDLTNTDPRRSDGHATVLSLIPWDEVSCGILASQQLTGESVPAAGQRVLLRQNANLSTGGTATDVTDWVHPEVASRAIEAARIVGLDIAGIDVVTTDITRALDETNGAIVEVNAGPGLRMHVAPSVGKPRPVGEAIVEMLFPAGDSGRVPVIAVSGVNGKTTTTRLVAHILSPTGTIGMTCTEGIYINGRRIETGDCSGPRSARALVMNPMVDTVVLETARGGILREGLGFDRCDIAVVTNIGEGDHLGLGDVHTLEKLAQVKRTIVDVVQPYGAAVLNADDPLVAAMASHCPGTAVYFSMCADSPLIRESRSQGGRVVFVRDQAIVLAEGMTEFPLIGLDRIPLTHGGLIGFQVQNVLAATAATWALRTPCEVIYAGLESFGVDMQQTPARFNLYHIGNAMMIVDYGHNTSSLKAVIEAIARLNAKRKIAVYSTAGDRRDEDIAGQGELLADAFDEVVLYEGQYVRGRAPGELTQLLKQGMDRRDRPCRVSAFDNWSDAAWHGIRQLEDGDVLLLQADHADEGVQFIESLRLHRADVIPVRSVTPTARRPAGHINSLARDA
ncbi:MAG: cyanophycin synthetase [Planctomycetales bacterium]|nr:cyanophycin synthetase [Planctomycetales bacterium]